MIGISDPDLLPMFSLVPIVWDEYVWRCPWGHWIADNPMCSECFWGEDTPIGQEGYIPCPDHIGIHRGVYVWHNVQLQANCPENHHLWEMLERGPIEDSVITQSICLHKRNFEISSPSEGLRTEVVEQPELD